MRNLLIIIILTTTCCFAQDGTIDNSFNIANNLIGDGSVSSVAVQSDHKIIICTNINAFADQSIKRIIRINADGTLDNSFNVGNAFDAMGYNNGKICLQNDGKILVGNNYGTPGLVRLNNDGSTDIVFSSNIGVTDLLILNSGKILVSTTDSQNPIKRFNSDGTLDSSFNSIYTSSTTGWGPVSHLALQSDGKIIISWLNHIARLEANGGKDFSFPDFFSTLYIECIAVQDDNKIILGGSTSLNFGGKIARLNSDGSYDTSFTASLNQPIKQMIIQQNGRILIAGSFTTYNGIGARKIARIFGDGNMDFSFNSGFGPTSPSQDDQYPYPTVLAMVLQNDNKIVIGGDFYSYDGTPYSKLVRLNEINVLKTNDENFTQRTVSVNPNPTAGEIYINSVVSPIKTEIFDITGNLISTELDLSNFQSGIYILKIHFSEQIIWKKIIKY